LNNYKFVQADKEEGLWQKKKKDAAIYKKWK